MRTVLVGSQGQLGSELQHTLDGEVVPLAREHLDLTDGPRVEAVLGLLRPDRVINAAAWNLVDRAEDEPQQAFAVNALGPRHLARWCGRAGVLLVQISSDYVFSGRLDDGAPRVLPYRETDRPEPLSAYGTSKLAGEHFVRALCREHLIVRTCGLYGAAVAQAFQPERGQAGKPDVQSGKGNFVETMLRLGGERRELRVVDDQRCTPTSAADLAGMIAALLEVEARGTFHATNAGEMTWCEFARTIFQLAGLEVQVQPITTAEYAAKAPRPAWSVLTTEKFERTTGRQPRPWQQALEAYLAARPAAMT